MRKIKENSKLIVLNGFIILVVIILSLIGNHTVPVLSQESLRHTIIIDAGHGGIDGGAVSCSGVYESQINLEIAQRLNDLMHLLGMQTLMIRDTDISVYTEGRSIAEKKVSDIKERVRIVNNTPKAIYLSIHQNKYSDPQYWGGQVFYNEQVGSKELSLRMQEQFRKNLTPGNKRQIKKSAGVYLMEHINCSGVLIECGFLSNPKEEALLRSTAYQKKICCVIATSTSQHLNT